MAHKASSKSGNVELTGEALSAEEARQTAGAAEVAASIVAEANAEIDKQLLAADIAIIRAISEGDVDTKLAAHKVAQDALRATKQ